MSALYLGFNIHLLDLWLCTTNRLEWNPLASAVSALKSPFVRYWTPIGCTTPDVLSMGCYIWWIYEITPVTVENILSGTPGYDEDKSSLV